MKNGNEGQYFSSWMRFRAKCTAKAKGRCTLTHKNWTKLKKWHLDRYLQQNTLNPFGFLFNMRNSGSVLFTDRVIRSKYFTLLKRKIRRKKEQEERRRLIFSKK